MNKLIEKWKPLLTAKRPTDGSFVPTEYHQECAEHLENIEEKFSKTDESKFKEYMAFCIQCYRDGAKFGGVIKQVL